MDYLAAIPQGGPSGLYSLILFSAKATDPFKTVKVMFGPTNPAEFWTMVAALGTALVAVAAVWGLVSLSLAKQDMNVRSQRESVLLAMKKMEEFAREIIPANNKLLVEVRQEGIPVFVQDVGEVCFGPNANDTEQQRAKEWVRRFKRESASRVVDLLNNVEAWSGYFTNRIADEEVVLGPCAQPLCSFVMQNYAFYLCLRKNKTSGNYPNTVALFLAWRQKLAREEQGQTMVQLLEQLNELHRNQTGEDVQHTIPRPLGTGG